MKFFMHRKMYKSISITGSWCALNCSFCGGKYLENMVHVNPLNFTKIVYELYSSGVRGLLISGGFRYDATLPIEPYIEKIREVRKKLGLIINVHLGLVRDRRIVTELKDIVDVVDYEFTLSKYIVNYVRRLKSNPEKYIESLRVMIDEGLHVVPHVFIWHPQITREELARELQVIEDMGLRETTLLIFITRDLVEQRERIAQRVLELVEYARARYSGDLYMGCMRPVWLKSIIDSILVENNLVDRIANPYYKILGELRSVEVYDSCCSIPEHLLGIFKIV